MPDLGARLGMIRDWADVDCATVNVSEDGFEQVIAVMVEAGIDVDMGVWSMDDVHRLERSGLVSHVSRVSVELATGPPNYLSGDLTAVAGEIHDALDELGVVVPRLEHGEKEWTWPLVEDAFRRGCATRVGFEDSLLLPDDSVAPDNAALVAAAVDLRASLTART